MLKWVAIKKRKSNAVLYGADLGKVSADVEVTVIREEDTRLPKPKINSKYIKPQRIENENSRRSQL